MQEFEKPDSFNIRKETEYVKSIARLNAIRIRALELSVKNGRLNILVWKIDEAEPLLRIIAGKRGGNVFLADVAYAAAPYRFDPPQSGSEDPLRNSEIDPIEIPMKY